jgi:hypothetical protein
MCFFFELKNESLIQIEKNFILPNNKYMMCIFLKWYARHLNWNKRTSTIIILAVADNLNPLSP